jgi:hypothetical protein
MVNFLILYFIIGLFWMCFCLIKTTNIFGTNQQFIELFAVSLLNCFIWPISMLVAFYRKIK